MKNKFFVFFALEQLHHFSPLPLLFLLLLEALLVEAHSNVQLVLLDMLRRAQVLLLSHHFLMDHLFFKLLSLVNAGFFEVLLVKSEMDGLMGLGGLRASL
jgi:hypothetical protein